MSKSWIGPQTGNKLYLVCECGAEPFEIARRKDRIYSQSKTMKYGFDEWLEEHADCGSGPDHFKLAHQFQMNSDQAPSADPVANAVRLALVKS